MCLIIKHQDVNKLKWKNNKLIAYKICEVEDNELKGYITYHPYSYGYQETNKNYKIDYDNTIRAGVFHVCLTKKRARDLSTNCDNVVVIPVIVYKKDFVAVGTNNEAVFTGIHITRDIYRKAIKVKSRYELI